MRLFIFLIGVQLIVLAQCLPGPICTHGNQGGYPAAKPMGPISFPAMNNQGYPAGRPMAPAVNNQGYPSGGAPRPVNPAPVAGAVPQDTPMAPATEQQQASTSTQGSVELVTIGNNQYYFSNIQSKLTWTEAQAFCKSHGLNLASIESADENAMIHQYVKKLYERSFWAFWLGASDAASETNWVWDGTQQKLYGSYTNWDDDQPSGLEKENCLVLHRSDGVWNDFDCSRTFSYICKKPQSFDNKPAAVQASAPTQVNKPSNSLPTTVAFNGLEVVPIGNNKFYFSNRENKLNWEGARNFCKTNNMELASIESEEENLNVNAYAKKLYERNLWGLWLGGTDSGLEGTWLWESTQQPLSYVKFDADQPGGGSKENCLLMHRSDARWNDFDCNREFVFICKVTTR